MPWGFQQLNSRLNSSLAAQFTALGAITLLALLLRLYKLGDFSFWIDEIHTLTAAERMLRDPIIWRLVSSSLIGRAIVLLGVNEWSLRLAPALFGAISVPILYLPFRRLVGSAPALLACLLLSISPWHLYWSQNARFYVFLLLFFSLSLMLLYLGLEKDRPLYLLGSILFLVLSVLERLTALFYIPVVFVYLLGLATGTVDKPKGFRFRNLALVGIPILGLGLNDLTGLSAGNSTVNYLLEGFFDTSNTSPVRLTASFVYHLGLPVFLLSLLGGLYLVWQRSRLGFFLSCAGLVPLLLLNVLSFFAFTVDRYVFMTLPCWILLCVVSCTKIVEGAGGRLRFLALGVVLIVLADGCSQDMLYYLYQNGQRPDWKGAFLYVQKHRATGDRILTTRGPIGTYYLGQEVESLQGKSPGFFQNLDRRTWAVVGEASTLLPSFDRWIRENGDLVDVRDIQLPGKNMEMRVYRFDPRDP